ncbi:hypothetical protein QLL95_gp0696 [Cotonvirus japonicus]|uniref:DUF2784 domain-containing protein n=1 Tax=Cotonvirus japonicus TaxID=2811091 RepID=A0ABM7NTN5_9VIRU|nr:hypothetical protein QLL95_gp0696 [Cotonvirus japonicus]BCS83427.1 hypothetical protein [Cotonvirus japonicus]
MCDDILMNYLVDIIKTIHLVIIVLVFSSIFIPNCIVKELALTFLIYLLIQYAIGCEKCGLTELEYMILGQKNHKQGFMYRIINPMIKIPEKYFNNGLMYVHIAWIAILIYQIYHLKCC